VLGKGCKGDRAPAACKDCGHFYLHDIGGAAQVLAECIKVVRSVHLLAQFGALESIRELEVERFASVLTKDFHNHPLHQGIFAASQTDLAKRLYLQAFQHLTLTFPEHAPGEILRSLP